MTTVRLMTGVGEREFDADELRAGILRGLSNLKDELELHAEAERALAARRDQLILDGRSLDEQMVAKMQAPGGGPAKPGSYLSTYAMAQALGQTAQALRFRFQKLDQAAEPENS